MEILQEIKRRYEERVKKLAKTLDKLKGFKEKIKSSKDKFIVDIARGLFVESLSRSRDDVDFFEIVVSMILDVSKETSAIREVYDQILKFSEDLRNEMKKDQVELDKKLRYFT